MVTRLVVVGDALLDRDLDGVVERLCPEAPVPVVEDLVGCSRPGGAALAATLAAASGCEVSFVTALAGDGHGRELAELLDQAGVHLIDLGLTGATQQKVRVRAEGRLLLRLDHGGRAPGLIGALTGEARAALRWAGAILVSDYGRGVVAAPDVRDAVAEAAPHVPIVWDPHPRGAEPVPHVRLVTPSRAEAAEFATGVDCGGPTALAAPAAALRERWQADAVAVTLGARGAVVVGPTGAPLHVPAPAVRGGDACGAGDSFASAAAAALARGEEITAAVTFAVHTASSFVERGGASAFTTGPAPSSGEEPPAESAAEVAARVRAAGGTVVATGGCFDLLHAGHVATLRAARALGDCLIVLLNSDESARRLKGPARPLVSERDRAAVLLGLESVDSVEIFGEETPEAALERIRPDVFAKGGDYANVDLPEADVIARWGGSVVILPYVEGLSTSRLIRTVKTDGATV